ncbi:WD40 domain containing protein [Pyrrhoderma noxium]|uniref:DNA damage-binding protein CMR1 n=1 Tax=Pyrrhoderma noxium TaxID=2282107 RepID=A0A286UWG1_9AGAM|nr:WD40 domain containing protein [Pyrrhoderma noxium]
MPTAYELEREANIARNQALLEQIFQGEESLVSRKRKVEEDKANKKQAKPVGSEKRVKRETLDPPRRQSARLRREVVDPNESPAQRRKRESEAEKQRKKEEDERLEAEERARQARRPRHDDLELSTLLESSEPSEEDKSSLRTTLNKLVQKSYYRRIADRDDFTFEEDDRDREKEEVQGLRTRLQEMVVVSRAKVTQDRVYSSAFHPEKSKDIIFFGDKHGQLGIWDARAPPDEMEDEDGDITKDNREGGKYWRLQPHWPATSKSSLSCIKVDPIDSHSVFTSAYDCTLRTTSFVSNVSREIFSMDNTLICSFDISSSGNELWVSDAEGGLSHVDTREDKSKALRYELSGSKIGCVSINPTTPEMLLVASNDRTLKIWDARKLGEIPKGIQRSTRAHWLLSIPMANQLRIWDVSNNLQKRTSHFSFKPFCSINHDCQTGRWVTIFKAQWSPNPDAYPHFTVGNMRHSLDIYGCKGDLLVRLSDPNKISAVQAVTCSHPNIVERAASGNASGRCVLWAPLE